MQYNATATARSVFLKTRIDKEKGRSLMCTTYLLSLNDHFLYKKSLLQTFIPYSPYTEVLRVFLKFGFVSFKKPVTGEIKPYM